METSLTNKGCKKSSFLTVQAFSINYFLIVCSRVVHGAYFQGIARTLERRFGLRSRTLGIVTSLNDVFVICVVLFVGYLGNRMHIPRALSTTAILLAASGISMTVPFFIYGPLKIQESSVLREIKSNQSWTISANQSALFSDSELQLCYPTHNDLASEEACRDASEDTLRVWPVLLCLALSQFFSGLAASGIYVLGVVYIEANCPKEKFPIYLGFLNSSYAFAPVFGFGLAAFATSKPEALFTFEIPSSDPRWIGCWWIGFIIISAFDLMCAVPMCFFPRRMVPLPSPDVQDAQLESNGTPKIVDGKHTFREEAKNVPSSVKKIMKEAPLVFLMLDAVFNVYILLAFFVNLSRYFEIHFRLSAALANIQVGILVSVACGFGAILGGIITKFFKMALPGAALFGTLSMLGMLFSTAVGLFISCPSSGMAGLTIEDMHKPVLECSSNCSCTTDRRTYQPVCGSDGLTYFSPCHAGCTIDNFHANFSDCHCIPHDGEAILGFCDKPCMYEGFIYTAVMFTGMFTITLGRVPKGVVFLGLLSPEQKSLGMGITSFFTNLLAFIPAPIIVGQLIDLTCILWQMTCGVSGACLLYDTTAFRYAIHVFVIVFVVLDILVMVPVTYILWRRSKHSSRYGNGAAQLADDGEAEMKVLNKSALANAACESVSDKMQNGKESGQDGNSEDQPLNYEQKLASTNI